MKFENRLLVPALLIGLPGGLTALGLLWFGRFPLVLQLVLTALVIFSWLALAIAWRRRIIRPMLTLTNLLASLREGDYSIKARPRSRGDVLGGVFEEINGLVDRLREQRLGTLEATALLGKVMQEIDVAVFTFDKERCLRFINRAGERLLAETAERGLGRTAIDLGLNEFLEGEVSRTVERAFPGAAGRWGIRWSTFREGGKPHQLLVISDLSRELREEERLAWERLLRVLGHELNNSLAPIKSFAHSLGQLLAKEPRPMDWEADFRKGLEVIGARVDGLARFMTAYTKLARLPKPQFQSVDLTPLVQRVAALEDRLAVHIASAPSLQIYADPAQIEQVLINLLRNAVDAALERPSQAGSGQPNAQERVRPEVRVGWESRGRLAHIIVEDNGLGLASTANLFVPFFTTKPQGTGIGLVLSRQIAEANGGSLTLSNRTDQSGCVARLTLKMFA